MGPYRYGPLLHILLEFHGFQSLTGSQHRAVFTADSEI
jgi:hypothetical protein